MIPLFYILIILLIMKGTYFLKKFTIIPPMSRRILTFFYRQDKSE